MNKKHILLITCDELRRDALSCYGGNIIKTPNIDSIAAHGIQYTRAYCTSPWCLPSRCSILTGKFPSRNGAYSNFRPCPLDASIPNLFNVLKKEGYRTAFVGKCHFTPVPYGAIRSDATLPYDEVRDYYLTLGIDDLILQDGKQVSVWFYDDYAHAADEAGVLEKCRAAVWQPDCGRVYPFPIEAKWHTDHWTGSSAAKYIHDYDSTQPAVMWLSFGGPHYPFDAPEEYMKLVDMEALKNSPRRIDAHEFDSPTRIHHGSYHGGGGIDGSGAAPNGACKNYDEEYWTRLRRSYYGNVALIDDMIGKVLNEAYQKWGDDLLVIFTADHGEMLGDHGLWGKNNCAYEDVWNVPLIVKYPQSDRADMAHEKVMLTDLFATCLTEAAVDGIKTDGEDLRDVTARGGHEYIFSEGEGYLAVSDGRYKYVRVHKHNENFNELIDLEADPNEFKNLIDDPSCKDALIRLERAVLDHLMAHVLP